ncbi:MAG: hypothetical protein WDN25_30895 [Acetobacteraceae bacterium]
MAVSLSAASVVLRYCGCSLITLSRGEGTKKMIMFTVSGLPASWPEFPPLGCACHCTSAVQVLLLVVACWQTDRYQPAIDAPTAVVLLPTPPDVAQSIKRTV